MSENNKDLTTSQEVASKKTEKVQKKDQKPGFFKRVAKWFHELKVEAKKVVWPNKKTVAKNTGTVLLCSLGIGACIWIFDFVAVSAVQIILNFFG